MQYKILITILLAACWYIFSGVSEIFYLLNGIIAIIFTLLFLSKKKLLNSTIYFRFKISYLKYFFWLIKEIVKSSIQVSIIIWSRKPKLSARIGWINSNLPSDFKKTIYANSITLTPGTFCLEIHGNQMQVHCLTEENFKDLNKDEILHKINNL